VIARLSTIPRASRQTQFTRRGFRVVLAREKYCQLDVVTSPDPMPPHWNSERGVSCVNWSLVRVFRIPWSAAPCRSAPQRDTFALRYRGRAAAPWKKGRESCKSGHRQRFSVARDGFREMPRPRAPRFTRLKGSGLSGCSVSRGSVFLSRGDRSGIKCFINGSILYRG
jgi:hypothetical protein